MSFSNLVTWASLGQIEESAATEVLPLVDAALEELDENDPRFAALLDIEQALVEGIVPLDLLRRLAQDFPPQASASPATEHADRLEMEYREMAASYEERQWRSHYYANLEQHLESSDDDELLQYADLLRERIGAAWQKYCEDLPRVETNSPEIEAGHRLMKDAYERWMLALDMVEDEADNEEILEVAEEAVRLLAAVGQLDRDVKTQATTMDPTFRPRC
jgi:hypothetical protein